MTNFTDFDRYDVGVVVGRFQIPDLHDGHTWFMDLIYNNHRTMLVVLGVSPIPGSLSDPLDFQARKQMILTEYPNATVLFVKDHESDEIWSKNLDEAIRVLLAPGQKAGLYGSRDSFLPYYSGSFDTIQIDHEIETAGTDIRRDARRTVIDSPEFRAGVIWASGNRYPTVYATVDVAVMNEARTKILLARKPGATKWRLPGGFAEPSNPTFEQDAYREVHEETGVFMTSVEYAGSFNIDDWRYRRGPDQIRTTLFIGTASDTEFALATADDDIEDVCVVQIQDLRNTYKDDIVQEHQVLIERVLSKC